MSNLNIIDYPFSIFNVDINKIANCYKCKKICNIEEMFIYNFPNEKKDNFICFDCSCNINESRALKDWENTPLSKELKKCSRCLKYKTINRFVNNNKYCSYCLLKKKWSRYRKSLKTVENNKIDNKIRYEMENLCNLCLKNKKLKDMFVYNSDTDGKSKYVCVNCSVNLEVCRLHDWENSKDRKGRRYCNRCNKWKSKNRFNNNSFSCQYCSLKRRRQYLIKKINIK